MLNSPMSESDQPAIAGGRPHSATTPGRCVAMKATWKPQTKKPPVSRRKLGSRPASRTACFSVFELLADPESFWCLPRSGQASGTMASERSPSTVRAPAQPSVPPRSTASGAMMNWPSEPPALTMPVARPRFSGGSTRATDDMSTPRPAMPLPPADTTPMSTINIQAVVAYGVSTVPSMTSRPPMAMTRPVPYLSANAPATGCVTPHMSCAQANARLIDAMPRPVAELIWPMKSATDWRTPKTTAKTSPAAAMIPRCLLVKGSSPARSSLPFSSQVVCTLIEYDGRHIRHAKKSSSGGAANELACGLADRPGKMRVIGRARKDQGAHHGRGERHRLFVGGALSPIRELPLEQPDQLLDPPARRPAYLRLLARHFAAGCRDRAAPALLGRDHVPVGKVGVHQGEELLPGLRRSDGPAQALVRVGAGLLDRRCEERIARLEVGIEAAVGEAGFLHDVGYADTLVAVLSDGACGCAQDPSARLFLFGTRFDRIHYDDYHIKDARPSQA